MSVNISVIGQCLEQLPPNVLKNNENCLEHVFQEGLERLPTMCPNLCKNASQLAPRDFHCNSPNQGLTVLQPGATEPERLQALEDAFKARVVPGQHGGADDDF